MSYFFPAPILFPLQTAASIQPNLQSLVFCRVGSASAAGHSGIQISSAAAISITDQHRGVSSAAGCHKISISLTAA